MTPYYKNKFNSLKQFVEALTPDEFEAVINYLVESVSDFVDGDQEHPMGRYYYESAAASCVKKFEFTDIERDYDIDMLAFEFSMFI